MNNNKQEQLFLEDVEQGLIENVKKHIEMKHVNIISCMDGERRNALHRASLEGHSLIVKLLLETIKTDPMYSLKQNKITKFVNHQTFIGYIVGIYTIRFHTSVHSYQKSPKSFQ